MLNNAKLNLLYLLFTITASTIQVFYLHAQAFHFSSRSRQQQNNEITEQTKEVSAPFIQLSDQMNDHHYEELQIFKTIVLHKI